MYTVYHIHTEPGLNTGYIGITTNFKLRILQHGWMRKKSNPHLRYALLKYKDLIKYSIIASGLDKETAEWVEKILRPFPNLGWNIARGGNIPPSPKGKQRSEKYRANISAAKQGFKNPMFGKKIIFSETHRKNLSLAGKGKVGPIPKGFVRKKIQCPHCGIVGGEGAMNRWHFDRCKNANK